MRIYKLTFLILFSFFTAIEAFGQWGAPYSNSWIVYGKPYAKILVAKKGMYKIPFSALPQNLPVNQPERLQLWHRGRQVAIISTTNNEIIFYGIPNDGATDSLFYRPMSSRMNPYWSMYSDQSAYFLTVGDAAGLRATVSNLPNDVSASLLTYQKSSILAVYNSDYSLSTSTYLKPEFINSFFEIGASRTGKITAGAGASANYPLQFVNLVNAIEKPVVKLMLHGRNPGSRKFEIYVGKDAQSLRLVSTLTSSGFAGVDYSFSLQDGDVDAAGKSVLSVKSVSDNTLDNFSMTYYRVTYPQTFSVQNKGSYEMLLPSVPTIGNSKVVLSDTPEKSVVYDITDPDKPSIILGSLSGLVVPRKAGIETNLLVSSEFLTIEQSKISSVDFASAIPTSGNYIIITGGSVIDGATQYAQYRSSTLGGGYKTTVVKIQDVYDQFNYGEPSPVGIRRFMDYNLSTGTNKSLFLIGKSITHNERMVRELPDEVPTVGYPASDNLLVEGLAGAARNVPAVPVGRLPATTNQQVLDYLDKVKDYESNAAGDFEWRKKILHLNGGKNSTEISQLKGLLASLVPEVATGFVGGVVTPFVKQQNIQEVEAVNITPEVNSGVGMITYFGHGSIVVTDLDMGFATDAGRGYNNAARYPFMYFNGCGVGNIFANRNDPDPTSVNRRALSMDWLLAPKKGAIAIVANSFESYVSPSMTYLEELYKYMFADSVTARLPIGRIQTEVAKSIVSKNPGTFDVGNLHQSILQGDPVLKVVAVDRPDYAIDGDEGIKLYAETGKTISSSSKIMGKIFLKNFGRYSESDRIPVQVTYGYSSGDQKLTNETRGFAYQDTLSFTIDKDTKLENIIVRIDPDNRISELKKDNNIAQLEIDWSVAGPLSSYPQGVIKDVVAPVLSVEFNDRVISNQQRLLPSPKITIQITDDRIITAEASLVSIFMKSCADASCDFVPLNPSTDFKDLVSVNSHSFKITLNDELFKKEGDYQLLVIAKDIAGNEQISGYQIAFSIAQDDSQALTVIASPNPATTYVKFQLISEDASEGNQIEWTIYDIRGIRVSGGTVEAPKGGMIDWYWISDAVPTGMYIYKAVVKSQANVKVREFKGRVSLVR